MINGVINVYKEKGFTSHDVVAVLRGVFKQKKIGHTGTLDPDAEGVLPVCLGKATKLCDMLTEKDKEYETVMVLGTTTDTQDLSGDIKTKKEIDSKITADTIRDVIYSFVGEYLQTPPMYSAKKVNGKKLYELARQGIEVERKANLVKINKIDIIDIDLPKIKLRVNCSKGTYIRTLCHDIGEKLGVGGCMENLIRTKVDIFTIEKSLKIKEIEEKKMEETIMENIIAIEDIFYNYPKCIIRDEFKKLAYNGAFFNEINVKNYDNIFEKTKVRVYDEDMNFIGIYQYENEKKIFKSIKMFLDI